MTAFAITPATVAPVGATSTILSLGLSTSRLSVEDLATLARDAHTLLRLIARPGIHMLLAKIGTKDADTGRALASVDALWADVQAQPDVSILALATREQWANLMTVARLALDLIDGMERWARRERAH
jgi:hypothetical protein